MKSSVSSAKNQWSSSLKNTLNLKDTAESQCAFNNVRAMSVLIDFNCSDQRFLVLPPTALPVGPSQPWAPERCCGGAGLPVQLWYSHGYARPRTFLV